MSHLRKEYKEFKQIHEQNFREAAEAWTEENVILINERLNRNSIWRLNSAIQRFDNKFGKYREQLPAISNILNNAENGLHLVITGKVGSRSAAQMLQRMSIIYNILSNFFGGDLGALLKTPAFRVAHQRPDEKIDKIVDQGHNVKEIRRNLAAALKPSEEERTIFRRAYKSFDMPTLDWNEAAKQLCCLSCNELNDLAGIQKVPMVVVDKENVDDTGLDEQGRIAQAWNTTGNVVSRVAAAPVAAVTTAGVAVVQGLMNRFKSRSKEMTAAIDKLQKYVSGVEGFEDIDTALKSLREKSKAAANTNFDLSGGIRGLLRHPSVVVMKQAVMATEAIEGVLKSWNEHIKSTYQQGIKASDLPLIKKHLEKTIKGGVFSRIKGAITGVKPFPGLSADDIIRSVMFVAAKDVEGGDEYYVKSSGIKESFNQKKKNQLIDLHENISIFMLTEDYKDLEKLVLQIGTFEKTPSGKVEDSLAKDIESANKQTSGVAAGAPGAQPAQKEEQEGKENFETEAEAVDEDLTEEEINLAFSGLERLKKNEIADDVVQELNKFIAEEKIPNVTDWASAEKMLKTYQSIIINDEKYFDLIEQIIKWEEYAKQERAATSAPVAAAPGTPAPATPAAATGAPAAAPKPPTGAAT